MRRLGEPFGHSITYRIAVGPRAGQKLFTLQTVAPRLQGLEAEPNGAHRAGGFSLHAGVDIAPNERAKLERLCRYVSRPPVACERLELTASGQVRYTLKTPYRDGTTHIVLEPLDLMARLAALVPKPRMHLTRYHGVFAPHSQYRSAVTPAQRGPGAATPRHVAMSWARRLKRVFGVQIECCARCGVAVAHEHARSRAVQDNPCGEHVRLERSLRLLHDMDGIAVVSQNVRDRLPAGAVGKRSMNEDDTLDGAVG